MACNIIRYNRYLDEEFYDVHDSIADTKILVFEPKQEIDRSKFEYYLQLNRNGTCERLKGEPIVTRYGIKYKKYKILSPDFVRTIKSAGTSNLGNTCYFNSLLIILWHIPEFRFIFSKEFNYKLEETDLSSIVPFFREMMENKDFALQRRLVEESGSLVEKSLLELFYENHLSKHGYILGEQDDSSLLISDLLLELEKLFGLSKSKTFTIGIYHYSANPIIPSQIESELYDDKLVSFDFRNMFMVHIKQRSTTEGQDSIGLQISKQPYYEILVENEKKLPVQELFDRLQTGQNTLKIIYSSTYLFVKIHRVPEIDIKTGKFKEKGELKDFHTLRVNNKLYECIGLSRHIGQECTSGHYDGFVFFKLGNQWYRFDDERRIPINKDKIPGDGMLYLFRLLDEKGMPVPYVVGELDDSVLKNLGIIV